MEFAALGFEPFSAFGKYENNSLPRRRLQVGFGWVYGLGFGWAWDVPGLPDAGRHLRHLRSLATFNFLETPAAWGGRTFKFHRCLLSHSCSLSMRAARRLMISKRAVHTRQLARTAGCLSPCSKLNLRREASQQWGAHATFGCGV